MILEELTMKKSMTKNFGALWRRTTKSCMLVAVLLAVAAPVLADNKDTPLDTKSTSTAPVQRRPRIGLVLSGGGARGAAHIGVLKVLEELRVPIDYIAGTSMGSIVGGSYASGNSTSQMLLDIREIKTATLAKDAPPRQDISMRRKEDDLQNFFGVELGVRDGSLLLQKGVVTGVALEAVLRDLAKVKGTVDFNKLPIPFRAIATDIGTGKMVVFRKGDLAAVMRASMSVPGAVAPAEIDGMMLVDGGLTRNLPVDVARDMGAEVVIAVNLGTPLMRRDQIQSLLGVTGQMINILTEQNVQASLASLRPNDILISPELGDYSAADFDHMPDTVPIGEAAARKVAAQLSKYSLPPEEYAAHRRKQMHVQAQYNRPIDEIRVEGVKRVNPDVVIENMDTDVGKPIDNKRLDTDLRRIYGRGDFERVGYHLIEEPEKRILVVDAVEKSWGPDYLRFGLGLSSDFSGDSYFNVLMSYRRTWLNSLGAEWRNDLQFGQANRFRSEFYQPLSVSRYFFVAPLFEYDQHYESVFNRDLPLARYNLRRTSLGLDLGSQITKYAELRVGVLSGPGSYTLNFGPSFLAPRDTNADSGAVRARLRVDQLDSIKFPRSGYALTAEYYKSDTGLGAADNYTRWEATAASAFSFGPNTFQIALRGGGPMGSDPLPAYDQFSAGGFLQLSGYLSGQLRGQSLTLGRLVYYRLLSEPVLTEGLYVGASIEMGRVGGPLVPGSPTDVQTAGSLFVATDTPLGPIYLGYGIAEDNNRTLYFFLGLP
jgi:NTE family protein